MHLHSWCSCSPVQEKQQEQSPAQPLVARAHPCLTARTAPCPKRNAAGRWGESHLVFCHGKHFLFSLPVSTSLELSDWAGSCKSNSPQTPSVQRRHTFSSEVLSLISLCLNAVRYCFLPASFQCTWRLFFSFIPRPFWQACMSVLTCASILKPCHWVLCFPWVGTEFCIFEEWLLDSAS